MLTWLSHHLGGMSDAAVIAILALGCVQVTLQLFAGIDLMKRPAVAGGRKLTWALAIGLGGLVGAIVYLGVGRTPMKPLSVIDELPKVPDGATRRAVDRLYGPHDRP